MLVEFFRPGETIQTESENEDWGEDDGIENQVTVAHPPTEKIAIECSHVVAAFTSSDNIDNTILRIGNGNGYKVVGKFADVFARVNESGGDLVEFDRGTHTHNGDANKIGISPRGVAAAFANRLGTVTLKMPDRRGFQIAGTYDDVMAKFTTPLPRIENHTDESVTH